MSEIIPRKKGNGWEARTKSSHLNKHLSAYGATPEIARLRLAEKILDAEKELLLKTYSPMTTTLRSFFQTGYLPTLENKPYSREQALNMMKHVPFLDYPIKEITRPMIQELINSKHRSGLSYWTCFHIKKVLGATLNLAYDDELISRNPCRKVSLPPKPMGVKDHLTFDQLRRLISHAVHKNSPALPTILFTGLMGIGWDELRRIEPKHFKPKERLLHVPGTKNEHRPRDLYVDPRIMRLIKEHTFPLIGKNNGSELKTIKRSAIPMGITKCGRQALRNTTGTLLQSLDCPLEIRSMILGHSTKSQTMGYSHSDMIASKTKWLSRLVDEVLSDGWENSWESYFEIQGGFTGKSG